MLHLTYSNQDSYSVAVLIKESSFNPEQLERYYTTPLVNAGIDRDSIMFIGLKYRDNGKMLRASDALEYLEDVLDNLMQLKVRSVLCADGEYFKKLTKSRKAEPYLGYSLNCALKGYEDLQICLGVNYRQVVFNPAAQGKHHRALDTVVNVAGSKYVPLGTNVIKHGAYPHTVDQIRLELQELHQYPEITCDIEAFSLNFHHAGIASMGFAWDQHSGISFLCDYKPLAKPTDNNEYGEFEANEPVRALIRRFFETYNGEVIWHGSSYDLKVLVYTLWMDHSRDTEGMLQGLQVMTKSFHDTKLVAYLALNSCIRPDLGLKDLAHEFAGNWAQDDIADVRKIPKDTLLRYQMIDGLATAYVYGKYWPRMEEDEQTDIYYNLLLPSQVTLLATELIGMPMSVSRIKEVKAELTDIMNGYAKVIADSPIIARFNKILQMAAMEAKNRTLKVKQHPIEHFEDVVFKPNSGPQKQHLLYDLLDLPILDKTTSGAAGTGAKTIKKLLNHTKDPETLALLEALVGHGKADKILGTFIKAFEQAYRPDDKDDICWLHGSFNIGGTVSGRLSSSEPNLQNLPSGSTYGKLVKSCFKAPEGWVMCGADFNSLEDYISALTTRDPQKLRVYLEGFDGHSLRAYKYWPDEFPDIVETSESVNTIAEKYPELRQRSKGPTFLMTYQGKAYGLENTLGFSSEEAKRIYDNYHELYKVSDEWVQKKLDQAGTDGYLTGAFGLRVRTPRLARSLRGHRTTPKQVEDEARTAGNALGQSWGLLTNRALNAFMKRVWSSPYRLDILPISTIHDALYFIVRDNPEVIAFVNHHLIKEMRWQEPEEIAHDEVKIGAELSIFWPTWADETTLPNDITVEEIAELRRAANAEAA